MINLLSCEIKKHKNTYITSLGFLGMISPVILLAVAYFAVSEDLILKNIYNWYSFNTRIVEFFVFLVGPLITAFISISSIFYEYQSGTMKNILITPYSRTKIILGKMIYVSLLVIVLYGCVAILNIICALFLGFNITTNEIINYSGYLLLAGLATTVIVPLSMLMTLTFKSFIPAMVISVMGIIPNMSAYHWDKCYLSPWAAPEVIVLVKAGFLKINILYPVIMILFYLGLFVTVLLIYFNRSDQI